MSNPHNPSFPVTGRLTRDLYVNNNANGSKTVLATLAVDDDFASYNPQTKQSEYRTNYFPIEAYINEKVDGLGGWSRYGQGDHISVSVHLDGKPFTKKDGTVDYGVKLVADRFPRENEPASVRERRRQEKAAAQPQDQQNAAPAAPAAQPAQPAAPQQKTVEQLQAELEQARAAQNQAQPQNQGYNSEPPF